jgi:hypothetical protein
MRSIPKADVQGGYDEDESLYAIAHLLFLCEKCKEGHDPDCLINVCRSTLEMIVFGETIPYEGTPMQYLMRLSERYHDKAQLIMNEYQRMREQHRQEQEMTIEMRTA